MENSGRPVPDPNLHEVPYDDKWELLKPILEHLFVHENKKVAEISRIIDADYRFLAYPAQYTYRFKKWGWKKNIPAAEKRAMLDQVAARSALGKRTNMEYCDRPVDKKKLLRMVKQDNKRDIVLNPQGDSRRTMQQLFPSFSSQFGVGVFMNWNMPYEALRLSKLGDFNYGSPAEIAMSTSSEINAVTPNSNDMPSPPDPPTPLSKALASRTSVERAHMFASGKFDDLVRSMNKKEGEIMSMWLYQFWLFSFKTAKYWGQGPRFWNADNLGFLDCGSSNFNNVPSLPTTPDTAMGELTHPSAPYNLDSEDQAINRERAIPEPSSLCRCSIHYECDVHYEPLPESIPESAPDAEDDKDWETWPEAWKDHPFQNRLVNGLAANDFSSIRADGLPIAVPQIVKATERSPDELFKDAFAFSIMSRNEILVADNLEKLYENNVDVSGLYPLHLATSYLDGARACCNIFNLLVDSNLGTKTLREFRQFLENEFGHTVLDNLMIAILKAHTSTQPCTVNKDLKDEHRFVGEEVDICGRWDADSECFRSLLAQGKSGIPLSWKHKFCHTSIQTVCHCIYRGYLHYEDAFFGPSGLFLNHCSGCGLKMQLSPCHTLVMIACQLASTGRPGEDLFGIIACFLCLLRFGADATTPKEISIQALFQQCADDQCAHEQLTPAGLANYVPADLVRTWPAEVKVGWRIFCLLLESARGSEVSYQRDEEPSNEGYPSAGYNGDEYNLFNFDKSYCFHCRYPEAEIYKTLFWGQKKLGILRAAVQAELLTYRRPSLGDPWISENLNLPTVLGVLENKVPITSIGFISRDLLKPFCYCGSFKATGPEAIDSKDVCKEYCSNMDEWNRPKFINYPLE